MSGLLAVQLGISLTLLRPRPMYVCMYFFFLYALRMQKSLECKSSTLQYAKRSKFKKLSHFVTEENSSTFAQRRKVDYYQVLYIAYKWEYYITAVQIVTCTKNCYYLKLLSKNLQDMPIQVRNWLTYYLPTWFCGNQLLVF